MAISMGAAILGSAVLGAGASILGGNKNSSAIDSAAQAQAQASQQATKLQREIYQNNVGYQQPIYNTGIAAMNQYNALLGLPQVSATQSTGTNLAPIANRAATNGNLMSKNNAGVLGQVGGALANAFAHRTTAATNPGAPDPAPTTTAPPVDPAVAANAAYDRFKNYTGYTTRLAEGQNALNAGYAGHGLLQSGDAMRKSIEYGQNFASGEFNNYMALLGGQQQLAPGAANALAGVGTNYANAAGQIAMNQGNNAANAAIAKANNSNAMLSGVTGALGSALGAASMWGGSSYR